MKKEKLKLKEIALKSFITTLEDNSRKTIHGEANAVDTSKINTCTPHGSIATCNPIDKLTMATVNKTIWSFCRCII